MNRLETAGLMLALAAASTFPLGAIAATSFGFEDVAPPSHTATLVPAGYAGADFEGFILRRVDELHGTGLNSNDSSQVLAIAVEATSTITFLAPTNFDGAFVINPSGTISFDLFLGASLVASSPAIGVNASFVANVYAGAVDRIVFHQTAGHNFSLDDITLSPAAPVPEPETLALMLAGLGILGFATARRKSVG